MNRPHEIGTPGTSDDDGAAARVQQRAISSNATAKTSGTADHMTLEPAKQVRHISGIFTFLFRSQNHNALQMSV